MATLTEYLREMRSRFTDGRFVPVTVEPPDYDIPSILDLTVKEFDRMNLTVRVKSNLLGGNILLVPNSHPRSWKEDDLVVYTADELSLLLNLTPAHIRRIHQLKKLCNGEIVQVNSMSSI